MISGPLVPYWWRVRRTAVPSEVGTEWTSAVAESIKVMLYPRRVGVCNRRPARLDIPYASSHGPARAPDRASPAFRARRLARDRRHFGAVRQPPDREPHRGRIRDQG